MFLPSAIGAVYVGADPTSGRFVRLAVTEMTPEQVAAWLLIAPATARLYVDPKRVAPATLRPFDNQPGAPVPQLPRRDEQTATTDGKKPNNPKTKAR